MHLQRDLKEFIALLNSEAIDYLIVGAHALAYHGRPRYTGDLDIAVRLSPETAARLTSIMEAFGFEEAALSQKDFLDARQVVQLGVPPNRIDIIMSLDGVSFDDAWAARIDTRIDGVDTHVISREHLIQDKRATVRPQDLVDIEALTRMDGS